MECVLIQHKWVVILLKEKKKKENYTFNHLWTQQSQLNFSKRQPV